MSFCDFAENVEDAADQGCAYDYDDGTSKQDGAPQLLWLSDIPLFQPVKAVRPGGQSYLLDEDNDTELQCTYQSSRMAYRDECGYMHHMKGAGKGKRKRVVKAEGGSPIAAGEEFDSDDDEEEKGAQGGGGGAQEFVQAAGFSEDGIAWLDEDDEDENREYGEVDELADQRRTPLDKDGNPLPQGTPAWYEKHSSFLCKNEDPRVVIATLADMLACDDRIGFTVDTTNYQINCTVNLQEKPTRVVINVFKDVFVHEYLVEFQRQSGQSLEFQALYQQTLSYLNSLGNFLVSEINAPSSGMFNFVNKVRAATSSPEIALRSLREAMDVCDERLWSLLVEVRNDALRGLVVACQGVVARLGVEDSSRLIGLLRRAAALSAPYSLDLNTESARCIATILNDVCAPKAELSDEEKKAHGEFLAKVAGEVVPSILAFWEIDSSAKCFARRNETDKQIMLLLEGLRDYLAAAHVAPMEKKLGFIDTHMAKGKGRNRNYQPMRTYLAGTIDAVKKVLEAAVVVSV